MCRPVGDCKRSPLTIRAPLSLPLLLSLPLPLVALPSHSPSRFPFPFPFALPLLALRSPSRSLSLSLLLGAWQPGLIYDRAAINDLHAYGRKRGVRIVPEFDTPGHTRSWGMMSRRADGSPWLRSALVD